MRKAVPTKLYAPLFYNAKAVVEIDGDQDFARRQWETPFAEEISCQTEPWSAPYEPIKEIGALFSLEKERLIILYQTRNKQDVLLPMKKAKALMLQSLFWLNHEQVDLIHLEQKLPHLKVAPVNVMERVQFVYENDHYVAFIQLCAIMEELQKLNARIKAINERNSREEDRSERN